MGSLAGDKTPRTGTEYVPFTQEQAKYLNAGGYKPYSSPHSESPSSNNPMALMFDVVRQSRNKTPGRINLEGKTYAERYPDRQYIYMGDTGYQVEANPYYQGVASLPQAQSSFQAYSNQGPIQYDPTGTVTQAPRQHGQGYAYGRQGYRQG